MRVAVVFFEGGNRGRTLGIVRGLAKGIESQGQTVDIVDGDHDINTKLSIYEYIVVGTSAVNVSGGKISDSVGRFLANAGAVAGKRSFAFAVKKGFRVAKTLAAIMHVMEKEGLYLKYSQVISSAAEAEATGERLHID